MMPTTQRSIKNSMHKQHVLIVVSIFLITFSYANAAKKNFFLPSQQLKQIQDNQHLFSLATAVPCPQSENFTVSYYSQQLTDRQATDILNSLSDCPLWPGVKRLNIYFDQNILTGSTPFLQAFRRLKNPLSINLSLQQNKIINPGLISFNKLFDLMSELQYLFIYLDGNQLDDVGFLSSAFRQNAKLLNITLSLSQNQIINTNSLAAAFENQVNLQYLNINLGLNQIINTNVLATAFENLVNLQYLNIYLIGNQGINISSFQKAFYHQYKLEYMILSISSCSLSDVLPLAYAFQNTVNLKQLALDLSRNSFKNISSFATAFQNLKELTYLNIDLQQNSYLNNISSLSEAFSQLTKLQILKFSTYYVSAAYGQTLNIDCLANAFKNQQELQILDLNFQVNRIQNIESFKTSFKSLISLKTFKIDLSINIIRDISPLKEAFSSLRSVRTFYLDLSGNDIQSGTDELSQGLLSDIGPRQAFCPFYLSILGNPVAKVLKDKDILKATRDGLYVYYSTTDCENQDFSFLF